MKRRKKKKIIKTIIILIVITLFCIGGFFGFKYFYQEFGGKIQSDNYNVDILVNYGNSYNIDYIEKCGSVWYTFIREKNGGSSTYSLSVGDKADDINIVYETSNVTINGFYANEKYALWAEISNGKIEYDYYVRSDNQVYELASFSYSDTFPSIGLGLYNDTIYYKTIEGNEGISYFYQFNLLNRTPSLISNVVGEKETVIKNNLYVDNGYLFYVTYSNGDLYLTSYNLSSWVSGVVMLDKSINFVNSISIQNNSYILYYNDGSNKISLFSGDFKDRKDISSFTGNDGILGNKVKIRDGKVYFNSYENDLYKLNIYDLSSDSIEKIDNLYGFSYDDKLYSLGYNSKGYKLYEVTKK